MRRDIVITLVVTPAQYLPVSWFVFILLTHDECKSVPYLSNMHTSRDSYHPPDVGVASQLRWWPISTIEHDGSAVPEIKERSESIRKLEPRVSLTSRVRYLMYTRWPSMSLRSSDRARHS